MVLQEAPGAIESVSRGYAFAIGFSFTGKPLKDGFCHVVTYSTHVNLGFNRGALLPDPNGVLMGTGKAIRHISIRNQSELDRPFVRRYIQQSNRSAVRPLRARPSGVRGAKSDGYAVPSGADHRLRKCRSTSG